MTKTYLALTMDFMSRLPSLAITMSKNTNYQKKLVSLFFMSQVGDKQKKEDLLIVQNILKHMFARRKNQVQRVTEKEKMLDSFHLIQQVNLLSAFIGKSFFALKRKNHLLAVISVQNTAAILESKSKNVKGIPIVRVMKRQKNG